MRSHSPFLATVISLCKKACQCARMTLTRRPQIGNGSRLQESHPCCCDRKVEFETVQDHSLHVQDLISCVRVVGNVHEFVYNLIVLHPCASDENGTWARKAFFGSHRRLDLLKLGSDEHAGNTHKLKFASVDRHLFKKPVDVVYSQVERLGNEPILLRHLDQPVDQDGTHRGIDIALALRNALVQGSENVDPSRRGSDELILAPS